MFEISITTVISVIAVAIPILAIVGGGVYRLGQISADLESLSKEQIELGGNVERTVAGLRQDINSSNGQLRTEIHGARSELMIEIHGVRDELRAEFRTEIHGVRDELRSEFRTEIHGVRDELRAELRSEIGGVKVEIGGVRDEMRMTRTELLNEIRRGNQQILVALATHRHDEGGAAVFAAPLGAETADVNA